MTHDTAVRTVTALVPEIEKSGAESVLLAYADRNDLPAAQLEKLAQVFNTLLTLDNIEKSAGDRGQSVGLVDVPSLVVTYATQSRQEKAAAGPVAFVSSHDVRTVDLTRAMHFATQEKAASVQSSSPDIGDAAARFLTRAELEDQLIDRSIEARMSMSKLASSLLGKLPSSDAGFDISEAIRDARHACGDSVTKDTVGWLAKAANVQLVGVDFESPVVKRAFPVYSYASHDLIDLVHAFAEHTVMKRAAVEVGNQPPDISDEELAQMMVDMTNSGQLGHVQEALEAVDAGRGAGSNITREAENDAGATLTGEDVKPKPTAGGSGGGGATPSGQSGTSTGAPPRGSSGPSGLDRVLSALNAPIQATGRIVGDSARSAQQFMDRATSKERTNTAQRRTDVDVEDLRRAIGIRRMIGSDPVLKEADPRDVLEIYNAVTRTNPEIAGNMPALKLLLREAVNYEGLTLDSQKLLTDIRSNAGRSEAQEADNEKRRYSIGGGGAKPKTK